MTIYVNGKPIGGYERITTGGENFITPVGGESLLVGDQDDLPELVSAFNNMSAAFSFGTNGITYFANNAMGTGALPLGAAYVMSRAKGSGGSETAVQAGDFIGTLAAACHDGTDYVTNSTGAWVLPGIWFKAGSTAAAGVFDTDIHIGGASTMAFQVNLDNTGGAKIGFYGVTPVARPSAYTPTNVSTDRSYDANATTLDEVADVLGTLIADLQSLGLVG